MVRSGTDFFQLRTRHYPGLTLIEALVVVIILVVLVVMLWPVHPPQYGREQARQTSCSSNLRQLAIAAQSYSEDYGRYPDANWVSGVSPYLKEAPAMFRCPSDKSRIKQPVSYAYNGLLIGLDGKGVSPEQVLLPGEVGILCDAAPALKYPNGGILQGGILHSETGAHVDARHRKGVVVGFADGHVKYYIGSFDERDLGSGVSRAFRGVLPLGLVDNPANGLQTVKIGKAANAPVAIGGEYCTRSLLLAAAAVWEAKTKAPVQVLPFIGQDDTDNRPGDYLWGTGDGRMPADNAIPIARDAVVVIVAKGSRIAELPEMRNSSHEVDYPSLRRLFATGYAKETVQVYTLGRQSGTRRFFTEKLGDGKPAPIGKGAIEVADDREMVEKISNDPYGIGYCSSALADLDRVTIFALKTPDGRVHYYPQQNTKHRWVVPDSPDWPWTRTLYAEYGGEAWKADSSGIANVMLEPGGAGTEALRQGPLFGTGLWTPE